MAVLYHIFRRLCNSGKSTITVRQQACFVRHSVHQAEGKTSSVGHIRQTPRPKIKWVCIHHVYKVNRQSQSPNTSPRCDAPHRDQKRKTHPPNRRDPQYARPHAQVHHQTSDRECPPHRIQENRPFPAHFRWKNDSTHAGQKKWSVVLKIFERQFLEMPVATPLQPLIVQRKAFLDILGNHATPSPIAET